MKKCVVASIGLLAGLILDGCKAAPPKNLDACKNGDVSKQDCSQCVAHQMDIDANDFNKKYKGKFLPELSKDPDFKKAWKACAGPDLREAAKPKNLKACKNGNIADQDCLQCVAYKMDISSDDWEKKFVGKNTFECCKDPDFKKAWKACAGPDVKQGAGAQDLSRRQGGF